MTAPEPSPRWRAKAHAALAWYFRKRSYPRFILGLLVAASGIAGFAVSWILLHLGVEEMWQRWPLALIGGYIAFLGLLRMWVEIERDRYEHGYIQAQGELPNAPLLDSRREFISDNTWFRWLDALDIAIYFPEGCAAGCFIVVVFSTLISSVCMMFTFIMAGSELLAEVFLDAVVVSLLYRHLKNAARQHWLGTAVKRSWRLALIMAVVLAILGGCLSFFAPNSHSLGKALREIMK